MRTARHALFLLGLCACAAPQEQMNWEGLAPGTLAPAAAPASARSAPGRRAETAAALDAYARGLGKTFEACDVPPGTDPCEARQKAATCLADALATCRAASWRHADVAPDGSPVYVDYLVVPKLVGCELAIFHDLTLSASGACEMSSEFCQSLAWSTEGGGCGMLVGDDCGEATVLVRFDRASGPGGQCER